MTVSAALKTFTASQAMSVVYLLFDAQERNPKRLCFATEIQQVQPRIAQRMTRGVMLKWLANRIGEARR